MKTLLLLLSLFVCSSVFAKIPEQQNKTYIKDSAHVLSKKQTRLLNQRIKAFTKKTGVTLTVILVNGVPEEYTIATYAAKLSIADNEILYVIDAKWQDQYVAVAQSLKPAIDGDVASLLLSTTLEPRLSDKRYAKTINSAIKLIERYVIEAKAQHQKELVAREASNKAANETVKKVFKGLALVIAIVVGSIIIFSLIAWSFSRISSRARNRIARPTVIENVNINAVPPVVNPRTSRSTDINFTPVNDYGEDSNNRS